MLFEVSFGIAFLFYIDMVFCECYIIYMNDINNITLAEGE